MRLEWILLAEGIAQDAKGAFTLVGLNQNVFASEELPAQTKRVVLSRLTDLEPGQELHFNLSVADPNGRVIAAQQGQFKVQEKRFKDVPAGGIDIPAEFVLSFEAYGAYRISVTVRDVEAHLTESADCELYVVSPSVLSSAS